MHSEGLKAEYDGATAAERNRWGFDFDYMRDMQKYIDECDRRIDTAQRRLEKTPDEIRQTNNLVCLPLLLGLWTGKDEGIKLMLCPLVETNFRPHSDNQHGPFGSFCIGGDFVRRPRPE